MTGEYCVRGYSVMKGYWNDEKVKNIVKGYKKYY